MTQKGIHQRRRKPLKRSTAGEPRHQGLIKTVGMVLALAILGVALIWPRVRQEPERKPAPDAPVALPDPAPLSLELTGLSSEAQTSLLREAAGQLAQQLVTEFPGSAEAHVLRGNTLRQLGQSDEALVSWQRALALTPSRPDVYTYMAILAEEKGQAEEALAHWQKVLALVPDQVGVRDSLANTLLSLNRRPDAIDVLREELVLSPGSPRTHYLLGQAHLREKRFDEAIAYYQKTLALDPNFIQAYYELATALTRSGRRQEAQSFRHQFQQRKKQQQTDLYGFSALDDLRKAKRSLAQLATSAAGLYQAAGREQVSLSLLREAVTLDPEDLGRRKTLAARYRALDQIPEALGQCEQIASRDPNDLTCQMLIGSLSLQLKRYARAKAAFQRMIRLAPDQAYGYRELARLHLQTNDDPKQTLAWAQQAVTLEPSGQNFYVLALAWGRQGDAQAAKEALEQALRHDPGNPVYQRAYQQITLGR